MRVELELKNAEIELIMALLKNHKDESLSIIKDKESYNELIEYLKHK